MKRFESEQEFLIDAIRKKRIIGFRVLRSRGKRPATIVKRGRGHSVWIHTYNDKVVKTHIRLLKPASLPSNVEIVIRNKRKTQKIAQVFIARIERERKRTEKLLEIKIVNYKRWLKNPDTSSDKRRYEEEIERLTGQLKNLSTTMTPSSLRRELIKTGKLEGIEKAYLTAGGDLDIRTKYLYFSPSHHELGRLIIRFVKGSLITKFCNLDLIENSDRRKNAPHPWADSKYSICWGEDAWVTIRGAFNNGQFALLANVLIEFLTRYDEERGRFVSFVSGPQKAPVEYVSSFLKTEVRL